MKTLVLDGASTHRDLAGTVVAALGAAFSARGCAVDHRELAGLAFPVCNGDFGCWSVTPGRCVQRGPHRDLLREVVRSDIVVWLTPVTFGGYSSDLKRFLDHLIPIISPFMASFDGETHHPARYPRVPSLLVVGLAVDGRDAEAETVFHRVALRNALNFHPPHFASAILTAADLPVSTAWAAQVLAGLDASGPLRSAAPPLDLSPRADLPAHAPRRAVLLSGSPRQAASVSSALAADLSSALARRGVAATALDLHAELRRDPELMQVAATLGEADVIGLVAPLYVDSLPAPAVRALELLGPTLAQRPTPARFFGIVQCGFPEAVHTETALAVLRRFAAGPGLNWIGGLGIGGGGMLAPRPLAEQGGRARSFARALELTVDAVARGAVIPVEAQRLARKLPIPGWLYRRIADWGFRREARRYGVLGQLLARPDE